MTEYNKVITTVNSVTQDYSFIPDQNSVIVIDTSENRIGINTFNPLFSIDVSNGTIRTQDLIVLGNFSSSTNSVTFDSDIVPQQSQIYDLGSNLPLNLQWRDLYLSRRFYLNNIDFISIAGFGNDVIAINNTNSFIDISDLDYLNIRSDVLMQGNIGIGTTNPLVSIDINRTDAIRLPVGNNSQRPTGIDGYIRYNSQTNTFEGYGSGNWGSLGGVKDVNQDTYISAELSPGINNDELIFYTNGLQRLLIGSTGNYNFNASEFNIISNNLNLNNTLFNFNIQQYNIISNHFDISSQLIDISSNYFNLHSKHIDLSSQQIDISSNFLNLHSNYIDLSSQQIDISSNYFNLHSNYIDLSSQQIDISSNYFNLHSNFIDISSQSGYVNIKPTVKINNFYTLPTTQGIISQIIQYGIGDTTEWVNGPATEFNSTGLKSRHSGTNVNPINSISFGLQAGSINQSQNAIAIGYKAGNINQKEYSISIGYQSGLNNLGQDSIAIGRLANITDNSSIILNATGSSIITDGSGLYIAPINHFITLNGLFYNPINGKITYGETISNPSISNLNMGSYKIFNISDISINNDLYVTGHTYIRNMTISGHLLPSEDGVYDIGSATKKIRDLYLTGGTLYMDNGNSGIIDVIKVTNGVATFKGTLDIPDNSNSVAYFNYIEVSGNLTGDISATALTVNSSYQMPTTIGTANQVLTVPASGNTLTFTTPSPGGSTSIVNTQTLISSNTGTTSTGNYSVVLGHNCNLPISGYNVIIGKDSGNTSAYSSMVTLGYQNCQSGGNAAVAIGDSAGKINCGNNSVSIGYYAGRYNLNANAIAIGNYAGQNNLKNSAIAIGYNAGAGQGLNTGTIAIGVNSGYSSTAEGAVYIGDTAGNSVNPGNTGNGAICIGRKSGDTRHREYAVTIGDYAGGSYVGAYTIAIGANAARNSANSATDYSGCIVFNAQNTGADLNPTQAGQFLVKPIRPSTFGKILYYDTGSGEISYGDNIAATSGATAIVNTSSVKTINAGNVNNYSIAFGYNATCDNNSIAIGYQAISVSNSTAIGYNSNCSGLYSVAIGERCDSGADSVSIGSNCRSNNFSVAIGSGVNLAETASSFVGIGFQAGQNNLGDGSIAIGYKAIRFGSNLDNCICLNSTRSELNPSQQYQFMVKTRTDTGLTENNINVALCYDAGTGVITKSSAGYFNVSDNLFKYQEKNIINALDIINKLQPVNYVMTISNYKNDNGEVMKDKSGNIIYYNPNNLEDGKYGEYRKDWYYEAGFIAQDVNSIPELQQFVNPGDTPDKFNSLEYKRWTLSYNSIFTYNVAATQELSKKVENLEIEISTLKNENTLLKNALNQLLQDAGKPTI